MPAADRAATGQLASISPLPMSATTGTPSVASSRDRGLLDEALHAVVARVDLEHHGDVGARSRDGTAVVVETGAVRRADVDQSGTGLLHHVGDPERPADLDALAPADGNVASRAERGEDEQHGGGVVVDHHRRLGAAQPSEQLTDGALA